MQSLLASAGLQACAKHFPGHGNTSADSHFGLPRVDRDLDGLNRIELLPFRAAIGAGVDAIITDDPAALLAHLKERGAHVLFNTTESFVRAVLSDLPEPVVIDLAPRSGGCAIFDAKGVLGRLYWYAVLPFHHFVFNGTLRGVERECLALVSFFEKPTEDGVGHGGIKPERGYPPIVGNRARIRQGTVAAGYRGR